MPNYLLDACALLAFLGGEDGAHTVKELLSKAARGEITVNIHAANLIEVYYDRIRTVGPEEANNTILEIYNTFPITVTDTISPAILREAAYFKATGKMSFADAILVATARCTGATVVTCDHAELDPIEQHEHISFLWIRPKH
jgi:predicted nucleic acid-binding protein